MTELLPAAVAAGVATASTAPERVGGSGSPVLAIDLRGVSRADLGTGACDALARALIGAPWVTVATVDAALSPTIADLADRCDMVLGVDTGLPGVVDLADEAALASELERVQAAVSASPDAAVELVRLLRLTEGAAVAAALQAESLAYAVLQTGPAFRSWLDGRAERPASRPEPDRIVALHRQGSLLTITLDRPDKRNALNIAMRDQLAEALQLLADDPTLDGAVLAGAGANFCAGGDLDEFGTTPSPAAGHRVRSLRSLPALIHAVRDRLRVHVHGSCVGAGIELPAFAHSVIADPSTTFRLPEVGFGLVPGAGGTVSIPRRCGRHRSAWWAITGTTLDAPTALSWGLVDAITELGSAADVHRNLGSAGHVSHYGRWGGSAA